MDSNILNEMPETIERIFEKFNKRAEMLLQKYDRSFAEIEEELRLIGKLRIIKKRKEKLKADLDKWCGTNKPNDPIIREQRVSSQVMPEPLWPHSEDEEGKDNFSEKQAGLNDGKVSLHKTDMNNAKVNLNVDQAQQKTLELSIQLAAKYKEQAMNLENRLQQTVSSEQSMRAYLQEATEKEVEAKKHLENFMTGLLERAETAEKRAKMYKSRLGLNDSGLHRKSTEKRSKQQNDRYVLEILEPPSSQELPRRWKNKKRNRSEDQLPGIDLSNVIDTSIVWPFSEAHNFTKGSKPGAFSTPEGSSVNYPDVAIRRRIVLFCVFAYLDTETLLRCSLVCREWRGVSKHPKLWTRVSLHSKQISSEFLATMSAWCTETSYISLSNLKGRSRYPGETSNKYTKKAIGSLEDGMECLLQSCGSKLLILSIHKCDPFLTRRVLWLASCYNKELKSITFHSCEPLNAEVTWSLGAGCRKLLSLDVAPTKFCQAPQIFNNRVVQMISWCWPNLRGLSIGGKCIDRKGLLSLAASCHNIRVLELSNMDEVTEDVAKELIKTGFGSLHSLILTHTPIRTRALQRLLRLATESNLVSLRVQLSFADYCPTQEDQPTVIFGGKMDGSELFEAFNRVMQSLVRLQRKPEYANILEVVCTT